MASPLIAAYSQLERARTPYLGHTAPNIALPGLAIQPHPDFTYYWALWRTLRDCYAGEPAIKAAGQLYLRKLSAHKDSEYEGFLSRAYFYNAVRRTHDGLMASLFRKPPEFTLPPAAKSLNLENITLDGQSAMQLAKAAAAEVTLLGRYGMLVDLPDSGDLDSVRPYVSGYTAECIYSWRTVLHRGRRVLDRVVLRENEVVLNDYGTDHQPIIRVLRLDPDPTAPDRMLYSQEIITPHADPDVAPYVRTVPVDIRGRSLDYIPFVFCNAKSLTPGCEAPPLMDVATINVSHYQSTALLEHGRFYAGMPTYVISAGTDASPVTEGQALAVGPSNVWELEKDSKAWILEFNGHGLSFLENAVDSKQLQMQSLGGKLISSQRKAAALSSEAYSLMEAGDEATLLDVAEQVERAMALVLTVLADFEGIDIPAKQAIVVEMNKEFVRSDLTARELRAIQALYTGGLIPLDVLYYALRSVNVIPIEYSLEDFKAMLATPGQVHADPTGAVQAAAERAAKLEAARIAAHVDLPALQPIPAPGQPDTVTQPPVQPNNPPRGAPD